MQCHAAPCTELSEPSVGPCTVRNNGLGTDFGREARVPLHPLSQSEQAERAAWRECKRRLRKLNLRWGIISMLIISSHSHRTYTAPFPLFIVVPETASRLCISVFYAFENMRLVSWTISFDEPWTSVDPFGSRSLFLFLYPLRH